MTIGAPVSPDVRCIVTCVIAASWIALALLAIEPAPGGLPSASSPPCPATSFAGSAAFLVVGKISGKARDAIAAAQRARANKLEATVVRGGLFEGTGKGTLVVYGAFAREADAAARVAALAKKKIAAAALWSGKPASAAPLVRVCGDARREGEGLELPARDPRFSHVPVAVRVGASRYHTETDATGYFELWLAGGGKAELFVPAFKPETRDAGNLCGYTGSGDDVGEPVDLPAAPGGSVRAPSLAQTITHCGE